VQRTTASRPFRPGLLVAEYDHRVLIADIDQNPATWHTPTLTCPPGTRSTPGSSGKPPCQPLNKRPQKLPHSAGSGRGSDGFLRSTGNLLAPAKVISRLYSVVRLGSPTAQRSKRPQKLPRYQCPPELPVMASQGCSGCRSDELERPCQGLIREDRSRSRWPNAPNRRACCRPGYPARDGLD
jgi:hypothetical protein